MHTGLRKAARDIEACDTEERYPLTFICKDGSRCPAVVLVIALSGSSNAGGGFLLIAMPHGAHADHETLRHSEDRYRALHGSLSEQHEQVENALRKAEERYHTLFSAMDEGYCIVEMIFDEQHKPVDWRFVEVNPSFEKQTGLRECVGKRMREFCPDHEKRWFETYGKIALTGQPLRFVCEAKSLGRWFDLYAFRIGQPEEQTVAVLFTDITEHKRAEDAMRESERQFRAFVMASSDVVFRMSADWSELFLYRRDEGATGWAESSPTWLQEYIDPEDQAPVLATISEAIHSKKIFEMEHRIRRWDGSAGYAITRAVPLLNEQQEIVTWIGAVTDVTERNRAMEFLRESEERYRNLFNSIDEGYCIIEMIFDAQQKPVDFRFLTVNPSFERQTGIRDAVGKRVLELVSDLEPHWFEIFGKVAVTGQCVRFENEAKSLHNSWFDVYACSMGDAEKRKVAVVFNDITERKKIEFHFKSAISVAEKANRAKSEFLSKMSHELRTPLNAILGFAQLMQRIASPVDARAAQVNEILKAGWYLLDLINEILDLAVIESGALHLSPAAVLLHDVMHECEAMMEDEAQKQGIQLKFSPTDPDWAVTADPTRLKQVILNLLSNAVKYNRKNGKVEVRCTAISPDRMRISVIDTGAGLSLDKIAQLFQPFNRLGQESTQVKGTGIGLVVAKHLVELMGGAIGVNSTVGVGNEFWIDLRRDKTGPPTAIKVMEQNEPAMLATADSSFRQKVLYVEDNPANLMLVENIVASNPKIRLLSAETGNLGVAMARAHLPDVIVMDLNLPDINGYEALKILRQDPATKSISVISLSANAMPDEIQHGIDEGFFRYITKPLRINEFMTALDEALTIAMRDKKIEKLMPNDQHASHSP